MATKRLRVRTIDSKHANLGRSLVLLSTGEIIARIECASNWFSQGIGLLGRSELPAGEGLWLPGVASVHTFFMRFPIDLLFLDRDMRAIRIERTVGRGRLISAARAEH